MGNGNGEGRGQVARVGYLGCWACAALVGLALTWTVEMGEPWGRRPVISLALARSVRFVFARSIATMY
jgi:hypothetical protein